MRIDMKKWVKAGFVLSIVMLIGCGQGTKDNTGEEGDEKVVSESKAEKPNILYIMADDLGYGDVGYNGQDKILTPNIDRLASEGLTFNNHYAGSTVCGPSRVSLMTGLHTGHSPVRENPGWTKSGGAVDISDSDVTVAEELKRAGYATGIVGKWGLAENLDEGMANKQGFDYFYGFNRHTAAHHYYPDSLWVNEELVRLEGNVMKEKKGKYSHDLFTEKAVEFIKSNKQGPFFLYLAYTIPHYELTVEEEEKADYYKKDWPLRKMKEGHYLHDENGLVTYAAMVSRMDRDIGRLMDLLSELGIEKNTLVIFTSDNGPVYDDLKDEFFNSNGILRGKKRDLYEGGIRIPFVARWAGTIAAGTKTDHISAFWDFLATACDVAGIQPSGKTDGISYLPVLLGDVDSQKKHDYLYWEFNESRGPIQAVRKGKWKAVKFYEKPVELYDLESDPGEEKNIAASSAEALSKMEAILNTARSEHPEFPLVPKKR